MVWTVGKDRGGAVGPDVEDRQGLGMINWRQMHTPYGMCETWRSVGNSDSLLM